MIREAGVVVFVAVTCLSPLIFDLVTGNSGTDTNRFESTSRGGEILKTPTLAAQLRELPVTLTPTPTVELSTARRILLEEEWANKTARIARATLIPSH